MKYLIIICIQLISFTLIAQGSQAQYKRPQYAKTPVSTEQEKPTVIPEIKPVMLKVKESMNEPTTTGADKGGQQPIRKAEVVAVDERKENTIQPKKDQK